MSNNNLQTNTSSALHNAIMKADGIDRPPISAPDNYVQWKSRIRRYIDTKPNHEPYKYQMIANPDAPDTPGIDGASPIRPSKIILTGIDNDIYSTVDACPSAMEMWKAIERLKQGESINVQDFETNLYWEFGKFTSRYGKTLDSYYS
ncbi:hypothetical protein Tco_1008038, partial [Tanacetum coccineum]